MKTKSLALVWALVLVPPATVLLAQAPSAPIVGHVLMLDNESVLEGDITRDGECYDIKRPVGEIKVPVGKALVVCASMDEAFKILSSPRAPAYATPMNGPDWRAGANPTACTTGPSKKPRRPWNCDPAMPTPSVC